MSIPSKCHVYTREIYSLFTFVTCVLTQRRYKRLNANTLNYTVRFSVGLAMRTGANVTCRREERIVSSARNAIAKRISSARRDLPGQVPCSREMTYENTIRRKQRGRENLDTPTAFFGIHEEVSTRPPAQLVESNMRPWRIRGVSPPSGRIANHSFARYTCSGCS